MRAKILRVALLVLLAAAITLAVLHRDRFDAVALEIWISSAGAMRPFLFMVIYALATVLFLPGSVLTLAGGALFGPVWGTLYGLTGATVGAALAFLLARYLARDRGAPGPTRRAFGQRLDCSRGRPRLRGLPHAAREAICRRWWTDQACEAPSMARGT